MVLNGCVKIYVTNIDYNDLCKQYSFIEAKLTYKNCTGPGVVAHTCNPDILGYRRILSLSHPRQLVRPYLKNKIKNKKNGLGAWFK
jgi:hypothetical protein